MVNKSKKEIKWKGGRKGEREGEKRKGGESKRRRDHLWWMVKQHRDHSDRKPENGRNQRPSL